jgi:hypothetical protein
MNTSKWYESFKNDLQNLKGLGIYIDQGQAPKLEGNSKRKTFAMIFIISCDLEVPD